MLTDNFKACLRVATADTTCARCMEFFGRTTVIPKGTLCDVTWPHGIACVKCAAFCEVTEAVRPLNVYNVLGIGELFLSGRKEEGGEMLGALTPETFRAASLSMHAVGADLFVFLCGKVGVEATTEEYELFDGTNPDIILLDVGDSPVECSNRPLPE